MQVHHAKNGTDSIFDIIHAKNGTDSIFDIICVECERDPVLKHYGTTGSEPGVRIWVCSIDSFIFMVRGDDDAEVSSGRIRRCCSSHYSKR